VYLVRSVTVRSEVRERTRTCGPCVYVCGVCVCVCVEYVSMHVYAQNVALFVLFTAHLSLTSFSLGSSALASCTRRRRISFHSC
jgi:hypothetical protein